MQFKSSDPAAVQHLSKSLKAKNMGVVAHFYMDPELQGHLGDVRDKKEWEHVFISDSLAMGEEAVRMAEKGVTSIACLGVDFMSESVKANLTQMGFPDVKVFRLKETAIGCSLAESAQRPAYEAWLRKGASTKNALHVVYINTSMQTKAVSNSIMPTITCTSSNVVNTILSADAQIPGLNVFYGPDTYMGRNIKQLFEMMLHMPEEKIKAFHPQHTRETVKSLLTRFNFFQQGVCVVHHMFGENVTQKVLQDYPLDDTTFYTAHFEVPGEMFTLAIDAMNQDKGVVGSTSNILNFIVAKTKDAAKRGVSKVRFILGTESGMARGIVRGVQAAIPEGSPTTAEIIFPVNSEAVCSDDTGEFGDLAVMPGVKAGEGCSSSGGCASCPYMKMNSLDALNDLVEATPQSWDQGIPSDLARMQPKVDDQLVGGKPVAVAGGVPIRYMRDLMTTGQLPADLVADITKVMP